jgi:hypothetical protein
MSINTAESLKKEGTDALLAKKYDLAIEKYTEAIELEPKGELLHTIISNRAHAYNLSGDYTNALMDANKLIDLAPRFRRSYLRLAQALWNRKEVNGAVKACDDGLAIDSANTVLRNFRAQITGGSASASGSSGGSAPAMSGNNLAKYSFYLRCIIVLHFVLYPLPGWNGTSFFRIMLCSLVNNMLVIVAHLGTPGGANPGAAASTGVAQEYLQKMVQNDTTRQSMQYLMYCIIFVFSRPFFLALFPIMSIEGWWFAKTLGGYYPSVAKTLGSIVQPAANLLVQPDPGQSSVTLNSLAAKIRPWNASVEVMIGMFLIFELFTPYRNFIILVVFWNFMKMRYQLDPFTKQAFSKLDGALSPIMSRIPLVGGVYTSAKGYASRAVAPPTPGAQSGGLMSGCTVM